MLNPLLNPSVFKPASNSDILPLLSRIKSNCTERFVGVHPVVLKKSAKEICSFFADTIKFSRSQGTLPSSWRDIHIAPLPKKQQSAHVPYKFRPIATYPAERKMCERFVLSQTKPFLEKSDDQNQFAYKKSRSALDAVGLLSHTIAKSIDSGSKVHKAVLWI